MSEQATRALVVNGVDVDSLFGTIASVKETPSLGESRFRITNRWSNCGQNQSRISGFHAAGEEQERKAAFHLEADEPPVLLGQDQAPNPVEFLLHSLAACLTTSMVYHAAARGIRIEEIESSLEGRLDLNGFLGLDEKVPTGYQSIRVGFRIKADVPDEELEELCQLGPTFSPVFDSLTRAVKVEVGLDR